MGTTRDAPWGASLPSARGMAWVDPYRGRLETSRGPAEVRLDAAGEATIRMDVDPPASSREALARNAALPLNVRYAGTKRRPHLAADAWLDGAAFSSCVAEFRRGVRRAARAACTSRPGAIGEPNAYQGLFDELARLDDPVDIDVVPRPPGWELGPRIRGRRVAVRVSPEQNGLRLYRAVLKSSELGELADGPRTEALGDAALRLNQRMRFARLALDPGGMTLEARLVAPLVDVGRVLETALAIATVSEAARLPLELLARHPGVATCYAGTFHIGNEGAEP